MAIFLAAGILAGLLWVWRSPTVADIDADGEVAVTSDLILGVLGLVLGFVVGLVCARRARHRPMTVVVAVTVGSMVAVGAVLLVGQLLDAPPVRAWPVLLAWPIGALIAVVGVLMAAEGANDEPISAEEPVGDEPISAEEPPR